MKIRQEYLKPNNCELIKDYYRQIKKVIKKLIVMKQWKYK